MKLAVCFEHICEFRSPLSFYIGSL